MSHSVHQTGTDDYINTISQKLIRLIVEKNRAIELMGEFRQDIDRRTKYGRERTWQERHRDRDRRIECEEERVGERERENKKYKMRGSEKHRQTT